MCFWHGVGFEEKVQLVFASLFSFTATVGGQNEDCSLVKLFGSGMTALVTLMANKNNAGDWYFLNTRNHAFVALIQERKSWVLRNILTHENKPDLGMTICDENMPRENYIDHRTVNLLNWEPRQNTGMKPASELEHEQCIDEANISYYYYWLERRTLNCGFGKGVYLYLLSTKLTSWFSLESETFVLLT